jgi:hypothetical protein
MADLRMSGQPVPATSSPIMSAGPMNLGLSSSFTSDVEAAREVMSNGRMLAEDRGSLADQNPRLHRIDDQLKRLIQASVKEARSQRNRSRELDKELAQIAAAQVVVEEKLDQLEAAQFVAAGKLDQLAPGQVMIQEKCGLLVQPPARARALTEILESDVLGLTEDLNVRAIRGPGFTNSRASIINDVGQLEGAVGDALDCVRVDGTAAPCVAALIFIDDEIPSGVINGSNAIFTITTVPSPATSLHVFRNGLLMKLGYDYTLSGTTITFVTGAIPQSGDTLIATYRL